MAQFYREGDKPTIYTGYDQSTGQFSGGISGGEAEAQQLGVIPDWEASWKPAGSKTNVTSITPDGLQNANQYDLSGQPIDIDQSGTAAASATASANEFAKQQVDTAQAKKDEGIADYTDLLTQLEDKGTDIAAAEETAGLPEMEKQKAAKTGEIAILNAELTQSNIEEEKMIATLERTVGIGQGKYSSEMKQIQREFRAKNNGIASEMIMKQAELQSIQGNISAATASVNRAIDLKYDHIDQEIKTKEFILGIISGDLTKAEQRLWDIQKFTLEQRQAQLDEQKDLEKAENKAKLNLIAKYSLVGVDINSTMDDINQAVMGTAKYAQETRLADGGGGPTITPQAKALNKDLTKEVQNLFDGDYGVEGAREKLIAKLQTLARVNYPELVNEIPKMVYGTDGYEAILPDGYEQELKSTVTKTTPFSGIPSFENIQ